MPLPAPEPGLVLHYEFLWSHEHAAGAEDGEKRRPAVIISAIANELKQVRVIVAPITHRQPTDPSTAIQIPPRVKTHLGLDSEPSWIILTELNEFLWPGFDLYPVPKAPQGTYHYGLVPPKLHEQIKAGIEKLDAKLKAQIIRD